MILQNNPKEKWARLKQLIEWGYITNEQAKEMYDQYCLIYSGRKKNERLNEIQNVR